MDNESLFPPLGYKPTLYLEETNRNREFWAARPHLSGLTQENLLKADILIVPEADNYIAMISEEDGHKNMGAFFPEGTIDFYQYLLSKNVAVEVAAEDDDFLELARHYDLHILGEFVLQIIAIPVFVSLLGDYLKTRVLNMEKSAIRIGVTIEKPDGSSKHLTYEGEATKFEEEIRPILREFLEEGTDSDEHPPLPQNDGN